MSVYKKTQANKLLVLLLVISVFLISMPGFAGAATGTDPNFTSGSSSLVLETQLSGESTNRHTLPERLWVNGDTLYVAVRSTHKMTNMTIGTATSYDFLRFDTHEFIYVDGTPLDPLMAPVVNGNDKDAHWTVFLFHTSDLVSSGTGVYPITVTSSVVGKGHWLENEITIMVPHVKATITKTWIGGPMDPINIQLYKESSTTTRQTHEGLIPLTAVNGQATYTWNPLPYTDDFGNVLTYSIEEPTGGSGYDVDFTNNGFTPDDTDPALIGSYSWSLTNTYSASGSLDLSGTKTLTGRDLEDEEFEFDLYEGETFVETVSNDEDGDFSFTTLNFDMDDVGTKTYTVIEKGGSLGGVTYDETEHTVDVTISDNDDGTLDVTVTSDNESSLDFTNTYAATGSLDLSGTKTLNGRDLVAGEFKFELYEGEYEGGEETPLETVSNDKDGDFSFTTLNFDLDDVGTKTFTVVEETGVLGGVTYSTSKYTVTVSISDNGDGTLDITVTSDNESSLDFTNNYAATGSLDLSGTKTLTGRDLEDEEFEFELYEGDTLLETVSNDEDGDFGFTALNFDMDDIGTKTYTVIEKDDGSGGVTYDDTEYTIDVTISDNGDGTLDVTVTSENDSSLDFTNSYAATGSLDLSGTKTLTGRDLEDEEFEFDLYEGDTLLETVSNDEDGDFSFTTLNFDLDDVGMKTYTVIEKDDGLGGVSYDATEHTIDVTIADNGDGTLDVTVTSENESSLDFTNDYAATGSLDLSGTKTLTGRDLAAGEFEFELYEGDTLLETVSNDADGDFSFTTLNFDLDDVGMKTYTVIENNNGLSGVTYDTNSYTMEVMIADNGDGTLAIDVTGASPAELNFTNTFIATITIITEPVPLAEPTTVPVVEPTAIPTIQIVSEPIPKAGESGPLWPIGLVLLALAGGISFIVHRSEGRKEQRNRNNK